MKASAWEFRFRLWLSVAMIALGFWAPWIEWLHLGTRTTTWLWLGFELSRLGIPSVTGIEIVTALAIGLALLAAVLRVWGTAYLGAGTVTGPEMTARAETGGVMADGPFRYVRNPLYLGSLLMNAAIAILMPPSGTAVSLVLITAFVMRLILGEEAFLTARLGEPYQAYRKAVPRLIPSLRSRVPASGQQPHWTRALLTEITPLGVLVSFSVLSWQYNASLLMRAILIGFGVSLVMRALIPPQPESPQPAA